MSECLVIEDCASRPLEDFLPMILEDAPGYGVASAAARVLDAVIEFMERSKIMRVEIPVDLQSCVDRVILDVPCGLRIVSVHSICGCPELTAANCETSCGGARVRFVPPSLLHISPPPPADKEHAFTVWASVAPNEDACEVPELIYSRYRRKIVHGALSKILRIPGTDFFNPSLADFHKQEFVAGITTAGMDRLLGYGMGPIQMRTRSRFV